MRFVVKQRVKKFGQIVGDDGVQAVVAAVLAGGDPSDQRFGGGTG